jgi:predicted DNA-binding transcriptional regulator
MKLTELTAEQRTTYVGLLTELQKDELVGQLYAPDSYFNPIQDINDNWVISVEEMEQNVNEALPWVKDLPLIPYDPKPSPFPPAE